MKNQNILLLVEKLNSFDGTEKNFEELKDIVCDVSESELKADLIVRELLYMAAQKMRIFGYNVMNGISLDEVRENDDLYFIKNRSIELLYTSKTDVRLDKKQKEILDIFEKSNTRRILVSAPTSFGKTFILREIIHRNSDRYRNIALIFPTVSLLNENVSSFTEFNKNHKLGYNIISSTRAEFDVDEKNIFILTPERILNLLSENEGLFLDFFFMDEIYKIDTSFDTDKDGDGNVNEDRDIVFRIVLYILSKNTPEFYLAGPYINTDALGVGLRRYIARNKINVLEIRNELVKKEHIQSWKSKVIIKDETLQLSKMGKLEKLKVLLDYLSDKNLGPTIIYAGTKNKVNEIARYCYGRHIGNGNLSTSLRVFIEHLRRRYSMNIKGESTYKYWSIINILTSGSGIHYGAFPKYIQNEILELFNKGELKNLFVTTSITEGVNTTAKNLIFYGSKKGINRLSGFDIRNINGRAGRYYHHFVGRIFYLEKEVYEQLNNGDDVLDFVTYGDDRLSNVDIDNTEFGDLHGQNATLKEERDNFFSEIGIDDAVFVKNRMVDRDKQLEIIKELSIKERDELEELVNHCAALRIFLKQGVIYTILGYFSRVGLIQEFEVARYGKIASEYANSNGFMRLLNYQLQSEELDNAVVDKAYNNVFHDIRSIVEYKIPKYISIFESLLSHVCSTKNIATEKLAFDAIIRFFELGVDTEVGLFLAESGFPIPTLKMLERQVRDLMTLSVDEFRAHFVNSESMLQNVLDEYEIKLMRKLLN